jgi:hypothetical protein
MLSEDFKKLWESYRHARARHEELKRQCDDAWILRSQLERSLVDVMVDGNHRSFEQDGMVAYLTTRQDCSVTQENEAQVMAWLNGRFGSYEDFMVLKLDAAAVKRLVKAELKDGASPYDYPEFLKVTTRPRLNVRGWGGLKEEDNDA